MVLLRMVAGELPPARPPPWASPPLPPLPPGPPLGVVPEPPLPPRPPVTVLPARVLYSRSSELAEPVLLLCVVQAAAGSHAAGAARGERCPGVDRGAGLGRARTAEPPAPPVIVLPAMVTPVVTPMVLSGDAAGRCCW